MCLTSVEGQVDFTQVATEFGVNHGLSESSIGAGISVYDFNQDGLDDLTLGNTKGDPLSFYTNTGSGFDKVSPLVDNEENVKQIIWVDFDNDGDPDLYVVANDGISRLYQNMGDLVMVDVTERSGLPLNVHFGYGACWADYNRDGWLDLYYASKGVIGDPDAIRSYNRLFKNNADGTFFERTEEADVADDDKLPFCSAFIDYNNDMWPDIYTANDKLTYNTLLENNRSGEFVDVSVQTGADARMNAMCVNPGDYNRDGWMDIYVTNTPIGGQLLENNGVVNKDGYLEYTNVAEDLEVHFEGGNSWGSNFFDADNDGDLDLYISSSIEQPREHSSVFYENIEGSLFDQPIIEGMLGDTAQSYTNAIGDINNDGLIDIIVQNNPPLDFFVWKNETESDHYWLKIKLEGVNSNRDAIGTRIEAYVNKSYQLQYTLCGSGFLGQNSAKKHIGLKDSEVADSIILTWSSGHVDKFYNLENGKTYNIREGSSTDGVINVDVALNIIERPLSTSTQFGNDTYLNVYPNPGTSEVVIDSDREAVRYDFININGQIAHTLDDSVTSLPVDTKQLESGLYFIRIINSDNTTSIIKWIKL